MSDRPFDSQRGRDELDRYITGNYGEDSVEPDEPQDPPTTCDLCGLPGTEDNPVARVPSSAGETFAHVECPK